MKNNTPLSKLTPDATLNHIIVTDPKAGELLTSIGLDPHKHKNQTLRSVCQQRKWSEVEVLRWVKKQRLLQDASKEEARDEAAFGCNLSKWCDYLKEEFHTANLELLAEIETAFPRVLKIHGNQYPWLKNMQWNFEQLEEALKMYYKFESKRFFPLLLRLQEQKGDLLHGYVRKLEQSFAIVKRDRDRLQLLMKTLSKQTANFKNPEGACSTMHILNRNFKTLFNGINRQFAIEQESLLPIVHKKTDRYIHSGISE